MIKAIVKEARGWLEDCGLNTRGMDATRILRTVHWNYDGGFRDFVLADPDLTVNEARAAIVRAHGEQFAEEILPE